MIHHMVIFLDVICLMALFARYCPWLPAAWDIPFMMRSRRHAATRYQGANYLGERRRSGRSWVPVGRGAGMEGSMWR